MINVLYYYIYFNPTVIITIIKYICLKDLCIDSVRQMAAGVSKV